MSGTVDWITAAAEVGSCGFGKIRDQQRGKKIDDLPGHTFPSKTLTTGNTEEHGGSQSQNPCSHLAPDTLEGKTITREDTREDEGSQNPSGEAADASRPSWEEERERRIYRGRTINMLRRYMRYSHETGRLPSLLGREFFRAKVTSYTVVTFEDRVIFVHDMETCLNKLDEFSRELIARHILQEHDQEATARLLGCSQRTVRTYVPIALDVLGEILLDLGLMERISPKQQKSCQGGKRAENFVSDCVTSNNKS